MANERISDLPSGAPAQPSDLIPIARAGSNFNLAASQIAALASGGIGGGINASISGNTLGAPIIVSSGTLFLAGGNNVTLSQLGNSVSILGAAAGGINATLGGNTAGAPSLVSSGTLLLAGGNNVTLSQNGQSITISAGSSGGVDVTLGGNTAGALALVSTGTLFLAGGNNITVSQNLNSVSILGAAAGGIAASLSGNTAGVLAIISSGTMYLAGGNNVTLSQNGQSITISANTAAAASVSLSAGTTTGTAGGITFSNANNIAFGLNNGTITASASLQTQAVGAIAGTGASITGNASITLNSNGIQFNGLGLAGTSTGATNVSVTLNSSGIAISVPTETGVGISALGQSASSGVVTFSNSNNISFGMAGSVVTATVTGIGQSTGGIYALGNTTAQSSSSTYALNSLSVSGAGIISVGWSASTLVISAPASTGISQSLYATGNTTQSSSGTVSIGSILFNGQGGVSVGYSNGSVVISGGAGGGGGAAVGMSTFGNTAGTTGSFSSGTYILVGTGPISLSQSTNGNGATLSINAPATSSLVGGGGLSVSSNGQTITVYAAPITRMVLNANNITGLSAPGQGSISVQYVPTDWPVTATRVDALVSWAAGSSATANTMGIAMSAWAAVFTRNVSTLSSLSSGSTQTTYTYASNSAGQTQLLTPAMRPISVPVNMSMTPGEYFIAFNFSTNTTSVGTATTNIAQTLSMMGANGIQSAANYAEFTAQTNTSTNLYGGMGVYTAASAGIGASLALSNIAQTGLSLQQANIALVLRNS